jgi:hypothetical protein
MGVSFLYPAFLIGALGAALPIVLHLLRRDQTPHVSFSAVRFLRPMPLEHSRRRRIREWLLLALRVTAVILLALAFARPYRATALASLSAPIRLLLVDTSYSMSARGQFDRLLAATTEALKAARPDEQVALVTFADEPVLLVPPTRDHRELQRALATVRPGAGATNYARALREAARVIGSRPATVVVVTDLQRNGWRDPDPARMPAQIKTEVVDVTVPTSNLAVSSLATGSSDVRAVIRNIGSEPREATVTLAFNDVSAGNVRVLVPPVASREVSLASKPPADGYVSVRVDDDIGYAADNVRFAVLDRAPATRVLLVTPGGSPEDAFYLARAFDVAQGKFVVQAISSHSLERAPLDRSDLVVLLSSRGMERRTGERLAEYAQKGGALLVAAGPDLDLAVVRAMMRLNVATGTPAELTEHTQLMPGDIRHPVFASFGAQLAEVSRALFRRRIVLSGDSGHVLARFRDGTPAMVEQPIGVGKAVILGSDLNNRWNDLPLRAAFVPLVHELARYLTADHERPREYMVADAPAIARSEPGVYEIASETGKRRVAVNVDASEGELERTSSADFLRMISRTEESVALDAALPSAEIEQRQAWWRMAAGLMLIALMVECVVASRGV